MIDSVGLCKISDLWFIEVGSGCVFVLYKEAHAFCKQVILGELGTVNKLEILIT